MVRVLLLLQQLLDVLPVLSRVRVLLLPVVVRVRVRVCVRVGRGPSVRTAARRPARAGAATADAAEGVLAAAVGSLRVHVGPLCARTRLVIGWRTPEALRTFHNSRSTSGPAAEALIHRVCTRTRESWEKASSGGGDWDAKGSVTNGIDVAGVALAAQYREGEPICNSRGRRDPERDLTASYSHSGGADRQGSQEYAIALADGDDRRAGRE